MFGGIKNIMRDAGIDLDPNAIAQQVMSGGGGKGGNFMNIAAPIIGQVGSMLLKGNPQFGHFADSRAAFKAAEKGQYIPPADGGLKASSAIPASKGGEVTTNALAYQNLKQRCLSTGQLFEDPDFPAHSSSLFYSEKMDGIRWLRPHEICSNPKFIEDDVSRFDIQQGALGDCWLLAAVACLSQHEELFKQVIPSDQTFEEGYFGCFRFIFWNFGEWKEVIVDDRLPCRNGKLVFMHSSAKNEFWSALLEKAYAKINGSYEALKGGTTSEALEDFTSGIAEMYDLRGKQPETLLKIMLQAVSKKSLLACSIDADPKVTEARLSNGLVMGHAYSITGVEVVNTGSRKIALVRIRNPWGNDVEWKGAFSDGSREWQAIPESERQRLELSFSADGEFWMSYDDFVREFEKLEICHLGPASLSEVSGDDHDHGDGSHGCIWESFQENGEWKSRVNAGGCRNFIETFWTNPQYSVTLQSPDDDDESATLIVGLMQKDRRALRHAGKQLLTIGYAIYRVPDDHSGLLNKQFFERTASAARSSNFINLREISGRHVLKPGKYVIVPSTFEPNQEASFMLRIFSEKKHDHSEVDEDNHMDKPNSTVIPKPTDTSQLEKLKRAFTQVAGADGEIDASELLDIINSAFSEITKGKSFSLESSRSLIAMMDVDRSGKLTFEEFHQLWETLRIWKTAFTRHNVEGTGAINSYQLREALNLIGYSISNQLFSSLALRFSQRNGTIAFDDFIMCAARLRTIFEIYASMPKSKEGTIAFTENLFLESVLYL